VTQAIVVMGVSGSGKSTVAEAVAEKLGVAFIEGDKLHPKSNVDKMS
jgi:gluconokinase